MIIDYLIKIGLAILLGILVGMEREGSKKQAGYRDVILVYLGATLVAILATELPKLSQLTTTNVRFDIGRLFAYLIVSLGFLFSGVIIQNRKDLSGVTTALTLWTSAISGLFIGIGNYTLAIISAIAIYLILKMKYFKVKIERVTKRRKRKR